MSDQSSVSDDYGLRRPPTQLRVHGVGGPQATRMLGQLHAEDTVTVPDELFGRGFPRVDGTRFVRNVPDDGIEAYEWGALTTGSWRKGLWIAYLPFTLINAAGWAGPATRRAAADGTGSKRNVGIAQGYRACAHAVALLGTVTYVLWIADIVLSLVVTSWREHVIAGEEVEGLALDAVATWLPLLGPLVFVGLVALLFGAPVIQQSRPVTREWATDEEGTRLATPTVDDTDEPTDRLTHEGFFRRSEKVLRAVHLGVAAAVTLAVLWLHLAGWHRIGLLIILTGMVQTFVLTVMGALDLLGRSRLRWHEAADVAELPGGLWEPGWPLPVGAALAAVGTVLTHSAFSAFAILSRELLARWPSPVAPARIHGGAELGAVDIVGGFLVLTLVGVGLTVASAYDDPEHRTHPIVAIARRAHLLGSYLLLACAVPTLVYAVTNSSGLGSPTWEHFVRWYDEFPVDRGSALTTAGSAAIGLLPAAIFGVLRGSHRTGLGRVIGNVWDVLTFWPRRFHPFAVPSTSERAVPQLRARIVAAAAQAPVVVVAHSQGSVLAVAALASADIDRDRVRLVTFGSPLGTLFAPTWPDIVPPALRAVGAGFAWDNFHRATDPIGAGVPHAANHLLADPAPFVVTDISARPPLERPRWNTAQGHSGYLTDHRVQDALTTPPPPEPAPVVPAPAFPTALMTSSGRQARVWAHRAGAAQAPANTIAAVAHALAHGADALEIDVQATVDDEFVVAHDRPLQKGSHGHGRAAHLTSAVVTRVRSRRTVTDGGAPGKEDVVETGTIPLLSELLASLRAAAVSAPAIGAVPLTIEVKGKVSGTATTVLAGDLADHLDQQPQPLVLVSIRSGPARKVRTAVEQRGHQVGLAPGFGWMVVYLLAVNLTPIARPLPADYTRVQLPDWRLFGRPLVGRRLLVKAHAAALGVDVWTVDEVGAMARLARLMRTSGAETDDQSRGPIWDGVMTDRPQVLRAVVEADAPTDEAGTEGPPPSET